MREQIVRLKSLESFRATIEDMDRLSQDATLKISAIARMALKCPDVDLKDTALQMILELSDDVRNQINCDAESLGANYTGGES